MRRRCVVGKDRREGPLREEEKCPSGKKICAAVGPERSFAPSGPAKPVDHKKDGVRPMSSPPKHVDAKGDDCPNECVKTRSSYDVRRNESSMVVISNVLASCSGVTSAEPGYASVSATMLRPHQPEAG